MGRPFGLCLKRRPKYEHPARLLEPPCFCGAAPSPTAGRKTCATAPLLGARSHLEHKLRCSGSLRYGSIPINFVLPKSCDPRRNARVTAQRPIGFAILDGSLASPFCPWVGGDRAPVRHTMRKCCKSQGIGGCPRDISSEAHKVTTGYTPACPNQPFKSGIGGRPLASPSGCRQGLFGTTGKHSRCSHAHIHNPIERPKRDMLRSILACLFFLLVAENLLARMNFALAHSRMLQTCFCAPKNRQKERNLPPPNFFVYWGWF